MSLEDEGAGAVHLLGMEERKHMHWLLIKFPELSRKTAQVSTDLPKPPLVWSA